ncbi:MAG: 30S ribosomal protein S17 [Phycisphaerae bacterium]
MSETATTASNAPAAERGRLAVHQGIVTSAKANKTIRVTVSFQVKHGKYGKYVNRRSVLAAHDEHGEANEGDEVQIAQCRPLSKTKHHRLVKVIRRAPETVRSLADLTAGTPGEGELGQQEDQQPQEQA